MTSSRLRLTMTGVKSPSSRRERAAATRQRIVEAALQVFVERGYTGAKMTDIAALAGVAVQTVYFTFHTKPELLRACYESAVLGPDRIPPPLAEWYTEALDSRTADVAVRRFAEGNAAIAVRAAGIDDVARAATHEPEAVEVRRG